MRVPFAHNMALSPIQALRLAKHAQTRARAQLPRVVREIDDELLKAPVRESGVPNVQFVTQGKDEPKWADDPSVISGNANRLGSYGTDEPINPNQSIRHITPNQFLELIGEGGSFGDYSYYLDAFREAQERGEDVKTFMPFLNLPGYEVGDEGYMDMVHDGRHRMAALRDMGHGDLPVPVNIDDWGYYTGDSNPRVPDLGPDVKDDPNLIV